MGDLGMEIDPTELIAALRTLQEGLVGQAISNALTTGMKATKRLIVTPSTWQQGNARYNYRQSGKTWEIFEAEAPMNVPSAGKGIVMVGWGNVEQRFLKLKRPEQTARFPDGRKMTFEEEKQLPTWVIMEYGVSGKQVHAATQNVRDLSSMGINFQRKNSHHYTPTTEPGNAGFSKPIFPNIVKGRNHPGVWPGGGFRRSIKLTRPVYIKAIRTALEGMMPS